MTTAKKRFELFLSGPPGLEAILAAEASAIGLENLNVVPGGVTSIGDRGTIMKANLHLRGATRVLMRLGGFTATALWQLDKRARKLSWDEVLTGGTRIRVDATCRKSRLYHSGAVAQRIADAAIATSGVVVAAGEEAPDVLVLVRINNDRCTVSIDTSGLPLYKRGFKQAVGKAPLRESAAALFLRAAGFDGREPVVDPFCGSGTLLLEAAEIAARLAPGRDRSFSFEHFEGHNADAWAGRRRKAQDAAVEPPDIARSHGSDRDHDAIRMARSNANRAGISGWVRFAQRTVGEVTPPHGPPGLVITNPPYGARIGHRDDLVALYRVFGNTMRDRFSKWRVSFVTSDPALAQATALPIAKTGPPVPHGPLRIRLYSTGPLP